MRIRITIKEAEIAYSNLLNMDLLQIQCDESSVQKLGELIDYSSILKKEEGLLRAIKIFDQLKTKEIPKNQYTLLFYYGGNAYSHLDTLRNSGKDSWWIWDRELIENVIISYRQALSEEHLQQGDKELSAKIFVNLGNIFNQLGRVVEAHNCWAKSLEISPNYPLALCNKGMGFYEYSQMLFDDNHKRIFLKFAFKLLSAGVQELGETTAKNHFQNSIKKICSIQPLDYLTSDFNFKEFNLGSSKKERAYRNWCLKNCLFLNPLNDIGAYSIFARDILSTPPMESKEDENLCPRIPGIVNQIKMEFINARYFLYLGLNELGEKFVNKDIHLIDTLDYPEYGINLEYIRASYRIAYSILDKIAFAMDDYYKLNMKKTSISMRSVWSSNDNKQKRHCIRPEFEKKNWALRGLYWLSKDLFENGMYRDAIEPEARELANIRNHLEHKYLKIHYMLSKENEGFQKLAKSDFEDVISYSVERGNFESKALKLMKITREAIIYFLLSININEQYSRQLKPKNALEVDLPLIEYKFY